MQLLITSSGALKSFKFAVLNEFLLRTIHNVVGILKQIQCRPYIFTSLPLIHELMKIKFRFSSDYDVHKINRGSEGRSKSRGRNYSSEKER